MIKGIRGRYLKQPQKPHFRKMCIRDRYRAAGGLDEAFFAHMEEIDLCWRLKNGGYTLKVVPSSVVYHLGGGSLPMNHPRKLFLNYRNNLLMLHKNLCAKQRKKIFFARVLLDTMAGGLFLLKGQWSNTCLLYTSSFAISTEEKNCCL